ncbi:MAG: SpoIID/LytB domain-containing protein [Candidatus Omnitrophica bacterium]|nr:SpoIID/LytB domain-containing protein [Candidatus Omnitrophota bacterium]
MFRLSSKKLFTLLALSFIIAVHFPCFAGSEDDYMENLYKGRIFFNQGLSEQAIAEYEKASRLFPDSKQALLNLAILYKDTGSYSQAINVYKRLLTISPDKIIYKNLGEIYCLNSQPDHAITALVKSLKLGSKNSMIYFWMAKAYEDKNDQDNAVWAYEQAIALDPELALAHFNAGIIYKNKNNWQKARQEFDRAKELEPSINEINAQLGLMYFYQDDYEQALALYKKALAADPENKDIQKQIELIYKRAGSVFSQKLGQRQDDRMAKSLAELVSAKQVPAAPIVRVQLGEVKSLRFKTAVNFTIKNIDESGQNYIGQKDTLYTVKAANDFIDLFKDEIKIAAFKQKIIIDYDNPKATILVFDVEAGSGNYWASKTDRIYRGKLEIGLNDAHDLRLINIINMEEYLYGVLPSEMPPDWPIEALKAQAIAARSEAYRKMGRHKAQGFDFCSEVHCQSYIGAKVETKKTNNAVDETSGTVAMYQGKPIDAVYSNSCGGHTQGNIFGDRTVIDYWLQKQDVLEPTGFLFPLAPLELEDWLWSYKIPVFCNNEKFSRRSNFRWMRDYSHAQLEALINKKINIGKLLEINILERNPSSHVHKIKIIGSKGNFIIEKELNIRNLLGNLRSGMFNLNVKLNKKNKPVEYIFYGGGWGHGVGMCQVGAASMADQGFNYQDILKFYFSGIEIEKIY